MESSAVSPRLRHNNAFNTDSQKKRRFAPLYARELTQTLDACGAKKNRKTMTKPKRRLFLIVQRALADRGGNA